MSIAVLWTEYKSCPNEHLKQKIIMNYMKLVHYVIHKSKFLSYDILDDRDYFQFGIEGLSEAIDRFDPDYGTKFETYAIQRIRGKIIDELRKIQIKPRGTEENEYYNVSLNNSYDSEDGYLLYETIPAAVDVPDKITEKNELKDYLIRSLKDLNERDRQIIILYYYEDLNYREIAEVLSITVSRVSQVHSKIINTLKNKLSSFND